MGDMVNRSVRANFLVICFAITLIAEAALPVRATSHTPEEVLLVYNANSPISMAIAKDYAAKRGVTKSVVIHCADSAVSAANETISLAD
jgi:hypothetical protein